MVVVQSSKSLGQLLFLKLYMLYVLGYPHFRIPPYQFTPHGAAAPLPSPLSTTVPVLHGVETMG